ncbi:MAG: hypothetical protein ACYSTS_12370 [Planctomycetota bacterium]
MEDREVFTNIRQTLAEEEENKAIYGILSKILKRYQPETERKKINLEDAETVTLSLKDLKKKVHSVKKELGETVILSQNDLDKGSLPEKKELNKTVILSQNDLNKGSLPEKKELNKTVILSQNDLNKGSLPEKKELNKTVILSPEGLNKAPVPENVEKPQEPLSKTVIISPQSTDDDTLTSSPRTLSENAGDKDNFECSEMDVKKPERPEFLTETVILKPGKERDEERDGNTA